MKRCYKCKTYKNLSDFFKDSSRKDGYGNKCKICQATDQKIYVKKNRKKINALIRSWKLKHPQKTTTASYRRWYNKNGRKRTSTDYDIIRKWQIKNNSKIATHRKVFNALKLKKLIKPTNCELCKGEYPLCAHHPNYSEPLNVIWVCYSCHKRIHNGTLIP